MYPQNSADSIVNPLQKNTTNLILVKIIFLIEIDSIASFRTFTSILLRILSSFPGISTQISRRSRRFPQKSVLRRSALSAGEFQAMGLKYIRDVIVPDQRHSLIWSENQLGQVQGTRASYHRTRRITWGNREGNTVSITR